jgi:hypothetical protein
MRFNDFRNLLDDALRDELALGWESCAMLLGDTAHHRQFILNLQAETRLSADAWHAVRLVLINGITQARELQHAFSSVFRLYALRGGVVPLLGPLGRAVTLQLFMKLLKAQFAFSSDDEAEQLLNDLLDPGATVESARETLEGIFLNTPGLTMWATFHADRNGTPTGEDPFRSMPPEADAIRAILGLTKTDQGKDLLLFLYDLPPDVSPRYPTIADAYAGNEWPFFFRPSVETDRSGMTMPWGDGLAPVPEVVHEAVKAECLRDRIRLARG